MTRDGRHLTLEQALNWNSHWSHTDQVRIGEALAAPPELEFLVPPSGGYIGVWVDGRKALEIRPGYLSWTTLKWAADLPPTITGTLEHDGTHAWFLLSTFRPNEAGPARPEPAPQVCPTCDEQLPATQVCDNCT